ncbi:MAG TPA: hypothetical protein VF849_00035 [Blattabacteriaceae bacterium]
MNLNQFRHRESNKAFTLKLSNGDKIEIPHMDFVAIGIGILVVIDSDNIVRTIDAEHIVEITEKNSINK